MKHENGPTGLLRSHIAGILVALVLTCTGLFIRPVEAETVLIDNVFIEIRAASAVSAKADAIQKAESVARSRLANDGFGNLGRTSVVKYFHIRDEKSAAGYYAATFQFAFETEPPSYPIGPLQSELQDGIGGGIGNWILAVPIHFDGSGDVPSVWDPEDDWTRYWVIPKINQQIPVIANVADDQDRELLASYMDGDYASLLEILAEKYGAYAAAFIILDSAVDGVDSSASRVLVDYWQASTGLLSAAVSFNYGDLTDATAADVAGLNAIRIIQMLASGRRPAARGADETISVPIRMEIAQISEWADAEAGLRGIDGAELTNVRIDGNHVQATILYDGAYSELVAVVAELGLLKRRRVAAQQR